MSSGFAVSDRGVRVPFGLREVIDVQFGGERIWSFNPERESTKLSPRVGPLGPGSSSPYLDGVADVSLVQHLSGETVLEERVAFGTKTDQIRLVDQDGHPVAVDKAGHLQRMFARTDHALTEAVLDSVEKVLHDLREECGLDAFLSFGCLLGAVRDGHMIGHDSDADVSYLSRHTHPFDIIRENKEAARTMQSLGWRITRMSAGRLQDLDAARRQPPGGHRRLHRVPCRRQVLHGAVRHGRPAPVSNPPRRRGDARRPAHRRAGPAGGCSWRSTYGPSWRVPDPSFEFHPSRATARHMNGWLRNNRKHLRHWGDFYRSRTSDRVPTTPSPFATWVADQLEPRQHVLDVGSGNGRDSVYFAGQGHRVTALDGTQRARRLTRRLAAQKSVQGPPAGAEPQRPLLDTHVGSALRPRRRRHTSTPASCWTPSRATPGRTSSAGPR